MKAKEVEGVEGVEEVKEMSENFVQKHQDLAVYKIAFDSAMQIFELSKKFPYEERFSLTDQIRRSSRSVCANIAEAWRKRRYPAAFIAKLNDCEAVLKDTASHKAAETQTWIEFAVKCGYLDLEIGRELYGKYNQILSGLVTMIKNSSSWIMKPEK
jgi:four helix bundle protein